MVKNAPPRSTPYGERSVQKIIKPNVVLIQSSRTIPQCSNYIQTTLVEKADAKILVAGHDKYYQSTLITELDKMGYRLWGGDDGAGSQRLNQVMVINGISSNQEEKTKLLETFAADRRISILMGQIGPLSEGKNLQMCDHLYLLDIPYVLCGALQPNRAKLSCFP